jgi:hypothetical protein
MPRDVRGRAVSSEAHVKMPAASKVAPDTAAVPEHCPHCAEHNDRLMALEKHAGIAHKPSGMKAEDQGGSGKAGAGHVTEKGGASYGRKRH